jgi:hypothetical protein
MFHKYRVKPIHCELADVVDVDVVYNGVLYAVQRKIFIWWTIKYFATYRGADLWIDKNIMEK